MSGFDPQRLARLAHAMHDPSNAFVGVLLSTDAFTGPFPPPAVIQDFWTGAYTALDD